MLMMDRAGLPVPGVMIEHGHTVDTADGAGAWHQKRSHMSQLGWGHHGVAHCHHRVATGLHPSREHTMVRLILCGD